jgi:acyl-CoA synthetase (AMP-forming)/AMP-acid ligase II
MAGISHPSRHGKVAPTDRGKDALRGVPPPASIYAAWGATIALAFGAAIAVLVLSDNDANWVKELLGAVLVGLVLVAFLLVYQIEKRRRFIYASRSEALDLAYAIEVGLSDVVAEWLASNIGDDKPPPKLEGKDWEAALEEVRGLESWLVDAAAYRDAAVVSDARRRAERSRRERSRAEASA